MSNIMMTPEGQLVKLFVKYKLKDKYNTQNPDKYIVRLEFDGSNPEHASFRKHISEINPGLIATEKVSKEGNFAINFKTQFEVKVMSSDGQVLDSTEVPNFDGRVDTGTARVSYTLYEKGIKPTICLKEVALLDLNITDKGDQNEIGISELEKLLKANSIN